MRVLVLVSIMLLPALAIADEPPSVVYVNGNIHTLDASRPRAEALAVRAGRLVAVGANAEIRALASADTQVIDLEGGTVLPGLIDAHGHFASLGSYGLGRLDLSQATSFEEVVAAVARKVKETPKGTWIVGGRWDHESWPERKLPTHHALSAASPEHPVWLTRVDGHAGLANAAAMQRAGITADTVSPAGGEILRDAGGQPMGIFVDNAEQLIEQHLDAGATDPVALILKAQEMCLAVGLTGIHDAGITPAEVVTYLELAKSGALKIRVYAMLAGRYAEEFFAERGIYCSPRFTLRSAKLYADGALGSRGAWLLEPYSDRPVDAAGRPYVGLNVMPPETLRRVALDGLRRGYQVCTHAIGDRANRETLEAYAWALEQQPVKDHRFRIEHAQIVHPDDIPRFARLGVIPAMQPTHCTSDMRWAEDRVGEQRLVGAYAWARFLRSGARVAGGSDFPIESHNPFLGIYAAITRQNAKGEPAGGWRAEERLTREEALQSFTLDAAHAAFEEADKGSLTPGKYADFMVIDRDILTCEPGAIPDARVLRTVIAGETVYRAPGASPGESD